MALEVIVMEGVFILPYSEYDVINKMSRLLKKSDNYGFYVPVSRQQKGVDFIIVNHANNKTIKVQVKGSRLYIDNKEYPFHLWFNNFRGRYKTGDADLYILYGLYPGFVEGSKVNTKSRLWKSVILCYSEEEIGELLSKVKTKKEQKPDRFFGFAFNDLQKIVSERGFIEKDDQLDHLLENYLERIKLMLDG